jgi:hypothetical protein
MIRTKQMFVTQFYRTFLVQVPIPGKLLRMAKTLPVFKWFAVFLKTTEKSPKNHFRKTTRGFSAACKKI